MIFASNVKYQNTVRASSILDAIVNNCRQTSVIYLFIFEPFDHKIKCIIKKY